MRLNLFLNAAFICLTVIANPAFGQLPMPGPPVMSAGGCAYEYLYQANGVYYYSTCTCATGSPGEPFGVGQSSYPLSTDPPCAGASCNSSVPSLVGSTQSRVFPEQHNEAVFTDAITEIKKIFASTNVSGKKKLARELIPYIEAQLSEYRLASDADKRAIYEKFVRSYQSRIFYLSRVSSKPSEFKVKGKSIIECQFLDEKVLQAVPNQGAFSSKFDGAVSLHSQMDVRAIKPVTGETHYFRLLFLKRADETDPSLFLGQEIKEVSEPEKLPLAEFVETMHHTHIIGLETEDSQRYFQVITNTDLMR